MPYASFYISLSMTPSDSVWRRIYWHNELVVCVVKMSNVTLAEVGLLEVQGKQKDKGVDVIEQEAHMA